MALVEAMAANAPYGRVAIPVPRQQENVFKVLVIGDSNVGKTSLTYRFCEGNFLNDSEETIGVDFRRKSFEVNGELITLQLWDTAGQERFAKSLSPHFYRKSDAIILVYDVTERSTFVSVRKWLEELELYCMPNVPKILVGNKYDEPAAVTTQEARRFADTYNMPFFETSAKQDSEYHNVESIFVTLAHKLKHGRQYLPYHHDAVRITGASVAIPQGSKCSC